jgi:hypothetical protein
MSAGLVLPGVVAACAAAPGVGADERYVQQIATELGLSDAQEHGLRVVLQRYRDEYLAVFQGADFAQLPPDLQAEVLAARRRQRDRIYALLTPSQQAKFDEKVRATGPGK